MELSRHLRLMQSQALNCLFLPYHQVKASRYRLTLIYSAIQSFPPSWSPLPTSSGAPRFGGVTGVPRRNTYFVFSSGFSQTVSGWEQTCNRPTSSYVPAGPAGQLTDHSVWINRTHKPLNLQMLSSVRCQIRMCIILLLFCSVCFSLGPVCSLSGTACRHPAFP